MAETLIIAEKPSVARDIARVLGATASCAGGLRGNGYTVTWAIGHLVTLPEPQEISDAWKAWRTNTLPMLPEQWPLKVVESTREQFQNVQRLLRECSDVICATDAGREGELIFRYIYEATQCKKQVRRLWISSLTPEAIRAGMRSLKDGARYDALADAARARSRADWLVGMNLSRAYALTYGDRYFVGRVQTPTLALVVKRDREIAAFKPEDFLELEATFLAEEEKYQGVYLGEEATVTPTRDLLSLKAKRLPPDGVLAKELLARWKNAKAMVHTAEGKTLKQPPPLLYDLTELQRHGNRLFGFSAARTLELAQALYEKHKLISYPRTDSNHLSQEEAGTLKEIVEKISSPYRDRLHPDTGITPLSSRFVDDSKVTDHHAIIPTNVRPPMAALNGDERKIYDLICRRLLALWQGDYVTAVTTVLTAAHTEGSPTDLFRSQGTLVLEAGWKILELGSVRREGDRSGPLLPSALKKGLPVKLIDGKMEKKTTRPPPMLNDASLLAAMESAGRNLEDRELQRAMRESGLGTPATRAGIIETLLKREYLERQGRSLKATPLGIRLIETVHPSVKSAELTGRWERELSLIQNGKRSLREFMEALQKEIKERVEEVLTSKPPAPASGMPRPVPSYSAYTYDAGQRSSPTSPTKLSRRTVGRTSNLSALLKDPFGFDGFRPYQEAVCRAVVDGKDMLLVMPTGAGKSLCYQLPGLARGGTTLVISPLVALIDDQVEKLKRMGLAAERIHSGRKREESRAVCGAYLAGELDFLFVAPERLAVPGFCELLQKQPLALVAIDEAHCISQWGHDFRPDYRLLGERLAALRPAPVIALTATATPIVQEDIVKQLGLNRAVLSIHGFRRTNIAIQLAEMKPSERPQAIVSLLEEKDHRPAIVYAPTRKVAESLAMALKPHFRAAAYHAGMPAQARDRVQENYLGSELDVIVATIAFGMGIDKANVRTVIHAALPGSVEGYYQEIGRAGRDGKPSRAILLHSYADRRTHEFFFDKSYPEATVLERAYRELKALPVPKDTLRQRLLTLDDETFECALEKLWIHKGALVDPDENVARGVEAWKEAYLAQREHRLHQMRQIVAFADAPRCRMLHLVEHFGDSNDSGEPCEACDRCRPEKTRTIVAHHSASEAEQRLAARIMERVSKRPGYAVGRLHQDLSDEGEEIPRGYFEGVLTALTQEGWLAVSQATFEKDGKTIAYRRLSLTDAGEKTSGEQLGKLHVAQLAGESNGKKVSARRKKAPRKAAGKKSTGKTRAKRGTALPSMDGSLWEVLRQWRLGEARRKGIPAFRIVTDAVLQGICAAQPVTESDLLDVKGVGPAVAARYGGALLKIVQNYEAPAL